MPHKQQVIHTDTTKMLRVLKTNFRNPSVKQPTKSLGDGVLKFERGDLIRCPVDAETFALPKAGFESPNAVVVGRMPSADVS